MTRKLFTPTPASEPPTPISLSTAHIYITTRDPNKSPPVRSSHLPISSQTSPNDSSPIKRPTSSNEVELHLNGMITHGEDVEEEEDEFAGLESIGFSQWEREVPHFKSRKEGRSSSQPIQEENDQRDISEEEDEIDELDESDHGDMPLDLIQDVEDEKENEQEVEVAIRSPIAGPSSPPLRTPAFSLPSLNSDIPSGPYPQTPHSHSKHPEPNFSTSSPVHWTPSPLSSRDKKRSLVILSDDSDQEDDNRNDHTLVISQRGNTGSPSKKGKTRAIQSDDDEEEEPLAVQKRMRDKGKGREVLYSKEGLGLDERPEVSLDDLFRDDEGEQEELDREGYDDYDPTLDRDADGDEEDYEFDEFGDFPFDQIDLDYPTTTSTTRKKSKSKSRSPEKEKGKHNSLATDLFPPDEEHDDKENYDRTYNGIGLAGAGISILDRLELKEKNEWDIPLVSDLEPRWQEFFKNHWRRGVDKLKAKEKAREDAIGVILSEEESEEDVPLRQSKTAPVKRAGWGFRGRGRGRGRGAWRGRAVRGKARRK
ncbi:hypothetical protein I302_100674 [Kwoniella bestiolae CBS 10118]|uniref:Uncharacterized protein n=1 Tax=Kwoniella bestiolae CBS 10118 TaxID=1296100 RepID=A0A1B9G5R3_9TREE|nr:hypothetical protein I302_04049 [Kwoniella bestiolae CBS 10118]OCF26366.1 hypothetical protein I302_04049 [Kwoniella bestiolae CBS 10118]